MSKKLFAGYLAYTTAGEVGASAARSSVMNITTCPSVTTAETIAIPTGAPLCPSVTVGPGH